eukprot:CAMPEP_0115836470 /NCGR_PEP_ID=MMETSP0287-20121206/4723_1 /TAXON_ID=412157 /ORGANISM="Chrysochromulina rotalis, Strain UIO044" /LENGTH=511 /DNA_ID=CAMNT_0003289953 /DNA_START=9 /DNA_END=1544 /DNA_ORIENTATION=-
MAAASTATEFDAAAKPPPPNRDADIEAVAFAPALSASSTSAAPTAERRESKESRESRARTESSLSTSLVADAAAVDKVATAAFNTASNAATVSSSAATPATTPATTPAAAPATDVASSSDEAVSPTLRRAYPELSSDELREARALFQQADRDGNGVLDLVEFTSLLRKVQSSLGSGRRAVMSDEELESLFRRADVDGNGTIELEEFLSMQLKHRAAVGAAAFARLAIWANEAVQSGNDGQSDDEGSELLPVPEVGGVDSVSSHAAATPSANGHCSSSSSGSGAPTGAAASSNAGTLLQGIVSLEVSPPGATAASVMAPGVTEGVAAKKAVLVAPAVDPGSGSQAGSSHVGRSETFAQPHQKRHSPLRRGSTMPAFSTMAPQESGEEIDERYRELLRNRAIDSAIKAPQPDVSSDELDMLELLFKDADINKDGVVDFDEFRSLMALMAERTGKKYNALQLRGLFRIADLDGSGSIDFNEFLHAQRRVRKAWGTAKAATVLSMAVKRPNSRTS